MISHKMHFRKNIPLSISDLNEAKEFAVSVNDRFKKLIAEIFPDSSFKVDFNELGNGNLVYDISNDSFEGKFEIVVGWDQKNVDGQNMKFMALNTSGNGENAAFKRKEPAIQKLPDKGFYGGALAGGAIGFGICMWYAMESDDFNMILFFITMIVTGWIGLKIGSIVGNKMLDKAYDKAQEEAMSDQKFLQSAGPWLAFSDRVNELMDQVLAEDQANAPV